MNVMGEISKLLRNRSFWYLAAFLVIVITGTYILEPYLLGDEPDNNVWHPVFVATRNFVLLGIILIAAWKFGFIAGLVALLVTGLISLPHVIKETIIEGHHLSVLTEYAIIIPVGVALSWLIRSLKQSEKKIEHLNSVLKAVRNVNQLITREKDRQHLIQQTCELLIKERIYGQAWLVLLDENGNFLSAVCAGLGESTDTFLEQLKTGDLPHCVKEHLSRSEPLLPYQISKEQCGGCAIFKNEGLVFSGKLVHNGKLYGILGVTPATEAVFDSEEQDLFIELCGDVAFALTMIEQEEKLSVVEKRYQTVIQTSIDGFWLVDTQGYFLDVNDSYSRLIGYSREELLKMRISDVEASELPEETAAHITKVIKLGGDHFETKHRRRDGRVIDIGVSTTYLSSSGLFCVFLSDITRQKQVEARMHFQSQILQNMSEGVQVTRVIDQVIVFTNPTFERMFGYGPEELLGKHVSVLNAPTDEQSAQAKAEEIIKGLQENGTWHGDVLNIRKDGSVFWCQASVAPFEHNIYGRVWIAVHQDITEHRIIEEELVRLRQAVETSGEVVFLTDREGVITYINPEFTKLYGYSEAEVIGKTTPRILKSGKTRPEEYVAFWNELICKRVVRGEMVNKTKDGRLITVEGSASSILNVQGNIIGFLAIQRDATERIKLQQQIMAQDRLASIGQLVSGVAHEINNPLTGVIGFSELLLKREDLPTDVKEDLKVVNGEATRASRIVTNLLTFARRQPEGKGPVKIHQQIQAVLVLRAHEQKVNNIQVITRFASDLPHIMGNTSQLQQVFFNIIINAEFFMVEAHQKGNLTITTERRGNFVRASFSDDGPGINPENMSKLFTPFFTTKEIGKGTGLGLSICHGIVTEHGGRIYAESEVGKGATFIVELPIIQATTR